MLRNIAVVFLLLVPTFVVASPVTFGLPDRTDLPDGATSDWSMSVPGEVGLTGYAGGVQYHAINTKGTGAQNTRCSVDSTSTTQRTILLGGLAHQCEVTMIPPASMDGLEHSHETVEYKDPEDQTIRSGEFTFDFIVGLVSTDGTGTIYTPIDYRFTVAAMNGATFSSDPTAVVDAKGDGVDFFAAVDVPNGLDISTTDTMHLTMSAATVVPDPANLMVGLLITVGFVLRGRGR